ncbi:MAG: alpha/beta fold hydrolase [Rectinemataceae bacterium]
MPKITVNGAGIYYESTDVRTAPDSGRHAAPPVPVAFLNGIAMSVAHWKPYVEAFSKERRCLCHDMRGQLMSDKPAGPYSFDMHADDLAALMDALEIEKAHLVGTSYGSEAAMAFALRHPGRCASLVLVDGVSELDPLLEAAVDSWKTAALADPGTFYKCIVPWTYSSKYIGENKEMLARRGTAVASLPREYFAAFAELCDAFGRIDLTSRLGAIACPTLVLVGDRDILKHEGFSRIIAGGIPGAVMKIVRDAGHAAVIEKPAECTAEIRAFLQGVA